MGNHAGVDRWDDEAIARILNHKQKQITSAT
jgi:hypothetical protein